MRAFYAAHAETRAILSQPVTESLSSPNLSQPVTESGNPAGPPEPFAALPWGHNLLLLHKLNSPDERLWYAGKAVEHGWSRHILALQIGAAIAERTGEGRRGDIAGVMADINRLLDESIAADGFRIVAEAAAGDDLKSRPGILDLSRIDFEALQSASRNRRRRTSTSKP
jgi:hypothetical protein